MSKIKNFIILALCLISGAIAYAGVTSDESSESKTTKTRLVKDLPPQENVPRTLINMYIDCTYYIGCIEVEIPEDTETMEVAILNEESSVVWTGVLSSDMNSAEIPVLQGTYIIVCNTDNGVTYIGTLEF